VTKTEPWTEEEFEEALTIIIKILDVMTVKQLKLEEDIIELRAQVVTPSE
jgi:hypothetical protein